MSDSNGNNDSNEHREQQGNNGDGKQGRFALIALLGCGGVLLLALLAGAALLFVAPLSFLTVQRTGQAAPAPTPLPGAEATQAAIEPLQVTQPDQEDDPAPEALTDLYESLNPGVVNIRVYVDQQQGMGPGTGAGSGFILDDEGHIVTNNHVVAQADVVTVVYFDGFQAAADIVGRDPDSDLAVLQVDQLPDNVYPLPLGDSDQVIVGERVIAIGNPFGLGSSLTVGYVSATGRTIPSGATPFSIPQAVQTDAAINPGNSGGPLLDMEGNVIGVNAQIATGGGNPTNAGVGFAIPANVVRRVAPVLIEAGSYSWPWLGVRGFIGVDLFIQRANNLDEQQGVYINEVVSGGPADDAGLQGSSGTTTVEGFELPVGGDVVIALDGEPTNDASELLFQISQQEPDDTVTMTVLRDGEEIELDVTLEARPSDF